MNIVPRAYDSFDNLMGMCIRKMELILKIFCDAIYPLDIRLCMIHHKERYLKSKLLFFLVRKSICDVPQGPATCVTIGGIAFPGRGGGGNVTVVNTHYCSENSQQIALLLLKLPHTKTIVLDIKIVFGQFQLLPSQTPTTTLKFQFPYYQRTFLILVVFIS